MDDFDGTASPNREEREGSFAELRLPERTYLSRSFPRPWDPSVPVRIVHKVFDPATETDLEFDGTRWLLYESPKGRVQFTLFISRRPGHVSELRIERIQHNASGKAVAKTLVHLQDDDARRLVELLRNLAHFPVEGQPTTRIDDALLADLLARPEQIAPDQVVRLYRTNPALFRNVISSDVAANDVVALAKRRAQVARFRTLLTDRSAFDAATSETRDGSPERVWQEFFEENPWILGTGLSGQLFTSWSEEKLEQVVAGSSVVGSGKRADAFLRTSGVIRFLTFAEFKTHLTPLLKNRDYRPGVWAPHQEVVGGVAQAQTTVELAVRQIGTALQEKAEDGSDIIGEVTFLTRPRSYLVVGHLDQLLGEGGGPHREKVRSFELYRRSLREPEIVTFDELLARAEWVVEVEAEEESEE